MRYKGMIQAIRQAKLDPNLFKGHGNEIAKKLGKTMNIVAGCDIPQPPPKTPQSQLRASQNWRAKNKAHTSAYMHEYRARKRLERLQGVPAACSRCGGSGKEPV